MFAILLILDRYQVPLIISVFLLLMPALSFSQGLETYSDPNDEFSIQYDPNTWVAVPDTNRFNSVLLNLGDVESGGDEVGVSIGKNPAPAGDVESAMRLALPNFKETHYDFELLEPIECQAYRINGQKTCTYVYTSGFNKYEEIYKLVNFKIGDDMWAVIFLAPGDTYDPWEAKFKTLIHTFKAGNTTSS